MFLLDIFNRMRFWKCADRIGPDIPHTHWRLYFKSTMIGLCKKKFYSFDNSSEFRPGAYAIYCSKISIGKRVIIRPNTVLSADLGLSGLGIIIEDDVLIGMGVHIYIDNHRFDDINSVIANQGYYPSKQVVLKKGCWIGANAIILPGVTIGENAVVGAGSVVTKSIPDRVVAAGNPATMLRKL